MPLQLSAEPLQLAAGQHCPAVFALQLVLLLQDLQQLLLQDLLLLLVAAVLLQLSPWRRTRETPGRRTSPEGRRKGDTHRDTHTHRW